MRKLNKTALFALLAALGLIAAACGSEAAEVADAASDAAEEVADAADDAVDEVEDAMDDDEPADDEPMDDGEAAMDDALPGEGVTVTMARADWSTGYFQAYVYQQLLMELGYDVTDPAELELGPSLAYLSMAQGEFDFWVNSWYPGHFSWHEAEMPDGSLVGDHVTIVGEEMIAGGLQGYLITKDFADEFGVYTLDALNDNPDALAAFDAADPVPGNGIADIYGCQESWTCDNIITNQIAFSGWENIQQTIAGYDAMIAEAVAKADAGEPMVIYTWTPSAYITQLVPGQNVYWAGVEDVLDDSNPTGDEGGEAHDQRPGTAAIGTDVCPSATDVCQTGWVAADILVTANNDFLEANPAAAALLEQVTLSVIDVSLANVEQGNGADTSEAIQGLAATWIENNRDLVDGWLAAAKG